MEFKKHSNVDPVGDFRVIYHDGTYVYGGTVDGIVHAFSDDSGVLTHLDSFDTTLPYSIRRMWSNGTHLIVPIDHFGVMVLTFDGSSFTFIDNLAIGTSADSVNCVGGKDNYVFVGGSGYVKAYSFDPPLYNLIYVTSAVYGSHETIKVAQDGNIFLATGWGLIVTTFDGADFNLVTSAIAYSLNDVSIDEYDFKDFRSDKRYIYGSKASTGVDLYTFNGSTLTCAATYDSPGMLVNDLAAVGDGRVLWVTGTNNDVLGITYDGTTFTKVYQDFITHGYDLCYKNNRIYAAVGNDGVSCYEYDPFLFVDCSTTTSGTGTSANPLTINQLDQYTQFGSPELSTITGLSAHAGVTQQSNDVYYVKGQGNTTYGVEFQTKYGCTISPWVTGEPWQLSADNPASYVMFGLSNVESDPKLSLSAFSVCVVENGIILDPAVETGGGSEGDISISPVSGSYIFRNNIFYENITSTSQKQWTIDFLGCSFISADGQFTEYVGETISYHKNNIVNFRDCYFAKSIIYDLDANYGTIFFDNCVFTESQSTILQAVSATQTSGNVIVSGCVFDFVPTENFPTYDEIQLSEGYSKLNYYYYNLPLTSATRSSVWQTSGYNTGFWNSSRLTAGAFNFGSPGAVVVDLTTIPAGAWLNLFPRVPAITLINDIEVDFTGTPRAGFTPLLVDFTANVVTSKYRVVEYHWYFDYDNYPGVYEVSTGPTISHVFNGVADQTFSIRCTVVFDSI